MFLNMASSLIASITFILASLSLVLPAKAQSLQQCVANNQAMFGTSRDEAIRQCSGNESFEQASPARQVMLRFDGVYRSELQRDPHSFDSLQYFRFYNDGLVISSSIVVTSSPHDLYKISKWFNRWDADPDRRPRGKYIVTGQRIMFTTKSRNVQVDYVGRIMGDTIVLQSFSHSTGFRGEIIVSFIKLNMD